MKRRNSHPSFLREHSLSLVASAVLITWLVLYVFSDERTHLGSFFGNAIADWTGVLATIVLTKYFFEKGSAESRTPHDQGLLGIKKLWRDHSLTVVLCLTGAAWVVFYVRMDSEGKWGQVVGNIVSEWTQLLGMVLLTKRLVEPRSKESKSK